MIRSRKILNHARGQQCQLRLPGICNDNPETTVFAHINAGWAGKGMGQKAHDFAGMFACSDCHRAIDTGTVGWTHEDLLRAVIGTWLILIEDGIIIIPRDAETLSADKTVKPRKPKEDRTKIQSRGFDKSVKRRFGGKVVER